MGKDSSPRGGGGALKAALVILWLFALVAAYFWAHKPFSTVSALGLGQSILAVAGWLGLVGLAAALGRRVASRWLADEQAVPRLALCAGVGLGLVALLTLGLGLAGLLRPAVAWAVVGLLTAVLWRDLRGVWRDLRAVRLPRPSGSFQRYLAIYAAISLSLTFLLALAPPTGWDTLVYHLTGPRLFVEAGRMVHPIDLPYLGFPFLGEMQFTLGLLLVGERVAPLLHFGYGLLALVITAALAVRAFGRDVAWLAATLLLSVPTLLSLMTRAYVDVTLLFYATAALYAFLRWWETHTEGNEQRGWLLLLGLFCGFCGGVKYTAVAIPFALALSLAWISRHDGLRTMLRRLIWVAAVTLAAVLPWLLENWLTTGNPVYPFFFSSARYWDEWRGWWYDRPGTGLATTAPWRLLTAPLEATVVGTEGTPLYEATIGPLLLGSGVLLAFVWRSLSQKERAVVAHLLLFFGVNDALWLNGLARTALLLCTRFLFLTFGAVATLGGLALERLRTLRCPQLDVAWMARAVISLTLALLLLSTLTRFLEVNPLPVILGLEAREDYLTRRLGWYYPMVEYLNQLPSDTVVLFLWEPRSYHCQIQCWPDALLDRFLHAVHLYGNDADAIAAAWRAEGVDYVLLHRAGLESILEARFDPVTSDDVQTLDELIARHMRPVREFGEAYALYRLEMNGP